jgi:DNA/RNA endonuclease YhcR with UshA esterase domain
MRLLSVFIFLFLSCYSYAQKIIPLEEVNKYFGDSITVCGKVSSVRYLENSKNSPTFINMGASYPNQLLTIVLWGDMRKQFSKTPEELFTNKEVCVTGRIELFKERPQIILKDKDNLRLKE